VSTHDIAGDLLGADVTLSPAARVVRLSDGSEARVGSMVYLTISGAQQILDEMFKAMGVKDLDGALARFVQAVPVAERTKAQAKAKDTFDKKMRSVGTLPFVVSTIVAADRVDLRSTDREVSNLPGVSVKLLVGVPQSSGALDFLKHQYGPLPLWGWGLIGAGTIGAGILVVRAMRK